MTRHNPDQPPLRPEFDGWLRARRITPREAATVLGRSEIQVVRYCLPFTNARRQKPAEDVLERIVEWTAGEIVAEHFYPPHLRTTASSTRTGKDDMADHVDAVSAAAERVGL